MYSVLKNMLCGLQKGSKQENQLLQKQGFHCSDLCTKQNTTSE